MNQKLGMEISYTAHNWLIFKTPAVSFFFFFLFLFCDLQRSNFGISGIFLVVMNKSFFPNTWTWYCFVFKRVRPSNVWIELCINAYTLYTSKPTPKARRDREYAPPPETLHSVVTCSLISRCFHGLRCKDFARTLIAVQSSYRSVLVYTETRSGNVVIGPPPCRSPGVSFKRKRPVSDRAQRPHRTRGSLPSALIVARFHKFLRNAEGERERES